MELLRDTMDYYVSVACSSETKENSVQSMNECH